VPDTVIMYKYLVMNNKINNRYSKLVTKCYELLFIKTFILEKLGSYLNLLGQ